MKNLLSTKEVAQHLGVNEKMVYTLVSEKGLPATKVTGKWLFPRHLVDQWIETHTINLPQGSGTATLISGLLIIAGSNDWLLDQVMSLYNNQGHGHVAVFGNLGSMGGINALRRRLCHMASSHLLQENGNEYNFEAAFRELAQMPVVVNFCRREQGIMVAKGNPLQIAAVADLGRKGLRLINRPLGTGTRLLLDRELAKAGIGAEKISGYTTEANRHMDVGLAVLSGRADAGPGIRPVADLLGLDFVPIRWERYDLLVGRDQFFEKPVQLFLGLLHEKSVADLASHYRGYDLSVSGKMLFPQPAADAAG
jgi:excisionase family DNA binding protein